MLYMLSFTIRECDEANWHAKLSLLLYYLLDLGHIDCAAGGREESDVCRDALSRLFSDDERMTHHHLDAEFRNGSLSSTADLEDFRLSFSLPASAVACWQSMYLLDCVDAPAGGGGQQGVASVADPMLGRACDLLISRVQADAPVKVLQTLVDLGRADVALSLHRASGGRGAGGGSGDLDHARTMLALRLR